MVQLLYVQTTTKPNHPDFIAYLKKTVMRYIKLHVSRTTVSTDVYWRKKLNFDQAWQITLAIENAVKNVHDIAACSNTTALTQPNIRRIDKGKSEKPCFRCDGKHSPDYCRFRDATCNFCQKTGHISVACLKRKGTKRTWNRRAHKINRDEHNDDTHSITPGDSASVRRLFCISRKKKKINPQMVLVGINDKWVEMEIDTGVQYQ